MVRLLLTLGLVVGLWLVLRLRQLGFSFKVRVGLSYNLLIMSKGVYP